MRQTFLVFIAFVTTVQLLAQCRLVPYEVAYSSAALSTKTVKIDPLSIVRFS